MIPDKGDMLMDNGSPSSPHQQKQIIRDLTNNSISKPGNLFFLISNRWFTEWKKYTGFGAYPDDEVLPEPHLIISDAADRPGPIDNSNIVSTGSNSEGEDHQLLDNLEDERDYVLVSQDVWEKLFEWYKGGPVLPRKMISVGVRQELVLEVYPLCLKVIDARDRSVSTIRLSKKASLHELHERVRSLKRTGTGKVRIWDYFNNRKQAILEDSTRRSRTLEKSDLQMNQSILVEVQVDEILLPTGFDMHVPWNEIKVCVNVCALTQSFFLGGFEPSDTVGIVKMRVNDLVFRTPITEKFLPLHPACGEMVSFEGNVFGDDETITSLYKSCCSKGDKYITMHYIRAPDLTGTPKVHRFIEEEIEESHDSLRKRLRNRTRTRSWKMKPKPKPKTKPKPKPKTKTQSQLQRGQQRFMGRSNWSIQ